jgi:uncharacterized Zn ribbon protein
MTENSPMCPQCKSEYVYPDQNLMICPCADLSGTQLRLNLMTNYASTMPMEKSCVAAIRQQ